MIYLYGLMSGRSSPSISKETGVTGQIHVTTLSGGHLIYGPHDGTEIRAKRRYLLTHARVLERLTAQGTVLPMQFGMLADSIEDVGTLVDEQKDVIADQMNRLAGHIELGVRIQFAEKRALAHQLSLHPELEAEKARLQARGTDAQFSHAEFGRKLGERLERHRTHVQHDLVQRLKPFVADLVLRAPETEYQVLHASVLLRREEEPGFGPLLVDLARSSGFAPGSEPEIKLVGPAPLYNFVRLNLTKKAEAA